MTIPALKRESRQVTLKVGNEYRALKEEDWTPSQSVPDTMNQHQWTMFVRLAEGEQGQVSDYVCHVEYGLHPTFKQSNVTVGAVWCAQLLPWCRGAWPHSMGQRRGSCTEVQRQDSRATCVRLPTSLLAERVQSKLGRELGGGGGGGGAEQ